MKSLLAVLVIGAAILASTLTAQENPPAIENFRFSAPTVRQGDTIRYSFSYQNFPGGLAAVKEVDMWVWWQRPGDRPIRSRFVPNGEELAKHTAESGTFESRMLRWRAPEQAPYGGVDVQYILKFTLPNGKEVTRTTMMRFEE